MTPIEIGLAVVGVISAIASVGALVVKPRRNRKPGDSQASDDSASADGDVDIELLPNGGFGISRDGFRVTLRNSLSEESEKSPPHGG